MTCVHRLALAAIMITWTTGVGATRAIPTLIQHSGPVELAIEMRNLAGVPPAVMRDTQAEVERTFLAAGVRIIWVARDTPAESPAALKLFIVGGTTTGVSRIESGATVVGLAPPSGTWAQVFYRRVVAAVADSQIAVSVVLAHVISHEIGHLLLPPNSHSAVGIMRQAVDLNHPALRRFTDEQSRRLRAAVMSGWRYAWPCDQSGATKGKE